MSPDAHWLYAVQRVWIFIALATITVATEPNSTNDAARATATAPAPVRLADVQQCPVTPKPMCADPTCQGATYICPTQFQCSSESPFAADDGRGRLLILAGCRCCPLPIHVHCNDHRCGAPEGARVCAAETLQGCACQTAEDRLEAMRAGCAAQGWTAADDETIEIDVEPDSGDEEEERREAPVSRSSSSIGSASPMATMSIMHDHRHLGLLPHYWAMDGGLC
ncbi:hypothetical protein PG993_003833 [Apiospora rasikravindrae]|uniref:Uncharacterized protein n=1 Tax=Apiospora rasikravindrae TaxID=990691 RepID=A0ABR1U0W3_9PEZI